MMKSACFAIALLASATFTLADDLGRPDDPEIAAIMREQAAAKEKGLAAAAQLPGYDELRRSFQLEDARFGLVNLMPESLFIKLRSTKPRAIDAVWWWNPLTAGAPSLSWEDFQKAFEAGEAVAAKHPWLADLKRLPGARSLELHLLGTGVGATPDDLATYTLPPWRHAGLEGLPAYCFLFRHGKHSWVEFFFSEEDDRAFIRYAVPNKSEPHSPLERLSLSWHPRGEAGEQYSQYAIVAPDGSITVKSYVIEEAEKKAPKKKNARR